MMHETILGAVLGSDKAKALGIVEPLHRSGGTHSGTSSVLMFVGSPVLPSPPTIILSLQLKRDLVLLQVPFVFTGSGDAHPCAPQTRTIQDSVTFVN
jgi:hypothetical protein